MEAKNWAKNWGSRVSDAASNSGTNLARKSKSGRGSDRVKVEWSAREVAEKDEVLKYWFLLEREMVKAIQKGNMGLIYLARARIDYLKKIVNK